MTDLICHSWNLAQNKELTKNKELSKISLFKRVFCHNHNYLNLIITFNVKWIKDRVSNSFLKHCHIC